MKFRASYSVLSQWASGNWERAIKSYFKLYQFTTEAMADGKHWHEKWQQYITDNCKLPPELGGDELINPLPEYKNVVELEPWLDLVGVIDCLDSPTIYEFKTGVISSEVYAGSKQPAVYGVLSAFSDKYVNRAVIVHYDQYTKTTDRSYIWLNDSIIDEAHEWILTTSADMHNYLQNNSLYERLGGK